MKKLWHVCLSKLNQVPTTIDYRFTTPPYLIKSMHLLLWINVMPCITCILFEREREKCPSFSDDDVIYSSAHSTIRIPL